MKWNRVKINWNEPIVEKEKKYNVLCRCSDYYWVLSEVDIPRLYSHYCPYCKTHIGFEVLH